MSKSLGVRASIAAGISNPASIDEAVLTPVVPTANLGAILAAVIAGALDEMVVVVDLDARIVHARPAVGVNAVALIDAVTGTTILGAVKRLEDKRSSVYIGAGASAPGVIVDVSGADEIEKLLQTPVLVSRSVSSVVSAIEDDYALAIAELQALLFAGLNTGDIALIVCDQHTARVTVMQVASANKATVRALFDDGGSLEDQARYEQIPAAEAAGATVLPFE